MMTFGMMQGIGISGELKKGKTVLVSVSQSVSVSSKPQPAPLGDTSSETASAQRHRSFLYCL